MATYGPAAVALLYEGDAFRGNPSLLGSGYRVMQSMIAIPGAAHTYNAYQNTGETRNYGKGSPANGMTLQSYPLSSNIYTGPYGGADEDKIPRDCKLWNDRGPGEPWEYADSQCDLSILDAGAGSLRRFRFQPLGEG